MTVSSLSPTWIALSDSLHSSSSTWIDAQWSAWGRAASTWAQLKRVALVVTDPGIIKFGLLDAAVKNLEANNIALNIYADVVADPPESVVLDAVRAAQEFGCDGVIGFGGGSSMDVAKLLAVLIKGEQPLADIYGSD